MLIDTLRDGADPGATMGAVFTASLTEAALNPKGKFLDHFLLSLNGTVGTAAVAIETFAGLLNPFSFKVGSETRIQLRAADLIALMVFFYNKTPQIWENTDATGSDFIQGIKIPIQETIDPAQSYTYAATRVAQTNITVETLALAAVYFDDAKGKKPIVAIELPYTTAAASGYTQLGVELPPIGKLIGLIVNQTIGPADGTFISSIQRFQMQENGQNTSKFPATLGATLGSGIFDGTLSPIADLLKYFNAFDFREEPIDLKTSKVTFSVDVEDVSDATRFIAVIERE